jgi:hypothetical protein
MRNIKLLTGVAVVALLAGAPSAWAGGPQKNGANDTIKLKVKDDIRQTTINKARVKNLGRIKQGKLEGKGASTSISASGAVSSISALNIADCCQNNLNIKVAVGDDIKQTSVNKAKVTNKGKVSMGSVVGRGASVSVSAIGAASVVSLTSIK